MNIIILTSEHSASAISGVRTLIESPLLKKHGICVVGVISASVYGFDIRTYNNVKRFITHSGFWFTLLYFGYQTLQNVYRFFVRLFSFFSEEVHTPLKNTVESLGIPYIYVQNINDKKAYEFTKKMKPDMLVSCFLIQILKKPMLDIPSQGSINIHPALTQHHRGVLPGFWALLKNWKKAGATVHYMTENLDDGAVILQKKFFVHPSDTVFSINEKAANLGAKMLAHALVKIKKKKSNPVQMKKLGPLLHLPNIKQVYRFWRENKKIALLKDLFK